MDIASAIPVVTGAGRGLGRSLVDELLDRGVARLYALARDPGSVRKDPRIIAVAFDLHCPETIDAAASIATDGNLLINNAATAVFAGPLDADPAALREEMKTNYEALYATIRAFVPVLEANRGHVVNVLSLLSLASLSPMAGYSASKAAAHSLTQALRPVLGGRGITVHGVYPGGIDTDMMTGVEAPKSPPALVASGIIDGLEAEQEDIFPDPMSASMAELWHSGPKAYERAFSAMAAA